MQHPRPAIAAEARERGAGSAATPRDLRGNGLWARRNADRAALHTQLAALEAYYGCTTGEHVARLAGDMLPDGIDRGEAARWAELQATLERMALRAVQEQLTVEESDEDPVLPPVRLRAA